MKVVMQGASCKERRETNLAGLPVLEILRFLRGR